MNDKQINKWLRRRFSLLGWVLLGYQLVMNVLAVAGVYLDSTAQTLRALASGDYSGELDMDAILGNGWPYNLTILVVLVALLAWKGSDYWKSELLVRNKRMTPLVFFCMMSLCIGAQVANGIWITVLNSFLNIFVLSDMGTLESVSGASDTFSMFLYSSILGPIAEEILFRGYVQRSLLPYGKRFAIAGSALLFGVFHGSLLQTPCAFLMGLVMGYLAAEYSLGWAIGLHMFNNLVLADLFTRLTMPLSDAVYYTLKTVIFGGMTLIAMVILVLKRQEIRNYRRSEWMDRRCIRCFFTSPGILAIIALGLFNMISLLYI